MNLEESSLTSSANFTFAFEGDNSIDASLLGLTLSNLSFIANTIVENDPLHPQLQFKVNAFEKGSFAIVFQSILATASQLSALGYIQDASAIFEILKGIFNIKLALKGNKPKKITEDAINGFVVIDLPDGTHIQVPLGSKIVVTRPDIDQKATQIAQAARLNNPNKGFRLSDGQNTFSYSSDNVEDMALPISDTELVPYEKRRTIVANLPIVKLALIGNAAWTFHFNGKNINASIEDEHFLDLVHHGYISYKSGDQLAVDLLIIEKYSSYDALIGTSYRITHVHNSPSIPSLIKE